MPCAGRAAADVAGGGAGARSAVAAPDDGAPPAPGRAVAAVGGAGDGGAVALAPPAAGGAAEGDGAVGAVDARESTPVVAVGTDVGAAGGAARGGSTIAAERDAASAGGVSGTFAPAAGAAAVSLTASGRLASGAATPDDALSAAAAAGGASLATRSAGASGAVVQSGHHVETSGQVHLRQTRPFDAGQPVGHRQTRGFPGRSETQPYGHAGQSHDREGARGHAHNPAARPRNIRRRRPAGLVAWLERDDVVDGRRSGNCARFARSRRSRRRRGPSPRWRGEPRRRPWTPRTRLGRRRMARAQPRRARIERGERLVHLVGRPLVAGHWLRRCRAAIARRTHVAVHCGCRAKHACWCLRGAIDSCQERLSPFPHVPTFFGAPFLPAIFRELPIL